MGNSCCNNYKAEAAKKEFDYSSDTLWRCCGSTDLTLQGGEPLHIDYMEKFQYPGFTCFLGKENIVYLFDNDRKASRFMAGYNRLVFPEEGLIFIRLSFLSHGLQSTWHG